VEMALVPPLLSDSSLCAAAVLSAQPQAWSDRREATGIGSITMPRLPPF
jgi:hypothetical protein